MAQKHYIHKQSVKVQAVTRDGFALKRKVERVVQETVIPMLGELFDRLAPEDRWIQIDRLDVELAEVGIEESDEQLAHKMVEAIRKKIENTPNDTATRTETDTPYIIRSTDEKMLEAFLHFLRHGVMPWWFEGISHTEFEIRLRRILPSDTARPYRNRLQNVLVSEAAVTRLGVQFGDDIFWAAVHLLFPDTDSAETRKAQTLLATVTDTVQRHALQRKTRGLPATLKKMWLAEAMDRKAAADIRTRWEAHLRAEITGTEERALANAFRENETLKEYLVPENRRTSTTSPETGQDVGDPTSENRPIPTSEDGQTVEAFLHFLRHGTLPTWFAPLPHAEFETRVNRLLAIGNKKRAQYGSRLQHIPLSETAVTRLAVQFSDDAFWNVALLLFPQMGETELRTAQSLLTALNHTLGQHAKERTLRLMPAVLKKMWLANAPHENAAEILSRWETHIRHEIAGTDDSAWVEALRQNEILKKYPVPSKTDPETENTSPPDDEEKTVEAFSHFLRYGTLPPESGSLSPAELEARVSTILRTAGGIRHRNSLRELVSTEEAIHRLAVECTDETFWLVVYLLHPETDAADIRAAQTLWASLADLAQQHVRQTGLQASARQASSAEYQNRMAEIGQWPVTLKKMWLAEIRQQKSAAEIRIRWLALLQAQTQRSDEPEWVTALQQTKIAETETGADFSPQKTHPAPPHTTPKIPYRPDGEPESPEGYLVANAGLVIVAPFLSEFFRRCGVQEENTLTDPEKALALLHYLVFGNSEYREYDTLLNKIICGLEPTQPIDFLVTLVPEEQQHAEEMLSSVVAYWEVLKSTSTDGLREGFLQRTGKLTYEYDGWFLKPEQQTLDILLQHLPWTIGFVKLPWMTAMIKTEWI